MIDNKQHHDGDVKSLSSLDDNDLFPHHDDEDLPMPNMTRAISDGYQGLRSSQHSSHSASWSESATYTRTKKRRETAVNRMNNGVLASSKSTNRISMDSTSSASDSNIQFHYGVLNYLDRLPRLIVTKIRSSSSLSRQQIIMMRVMTIIIKWIEIMGTRTTIWGKKIKSNKNHFSLAAAVGGNMY